MREAHRGEPIVLLHSSGLSSQQWRRLASNLRGQHRVFAPDFLGCGANPTWPSEREFELRMDVDPVRELLKTLDAPAHVVGHSYGAAVALALARQEPSRIASLTLYEPTAFGVLNHVDDEEAVFSLMGLTQKLFLGEERPLPGTEQWLRLFCEYWSGQDIWEIMPVDTRASFLHAGCKVDLEVKALMNDRTPLEAYRDVETPTLLMCGGKSPVPTRRIASRLAAVMPRARLHEFPAAGHLGPVTHPNAVNKVLEDHLGKVTVSASASVGPG